MTVWQSGGFRAYDVSHLVVIVLLVAGSVAAVALGRRRGAAAVERRTDRLLAVAVPAVVVPLQLLVLRETGFDPTWQLPVQLCDLAVFVAAYALWRGRRWAVALTYYWGLSLTPQALLTPDLGTAFPEPLFLLFWSMHLLVLWAALYLTWGRRRTPDWSSYRIAVALTLGWLVAMVGLNAALGSNYGYLSEKPPTPSILDLLGPWPVYVGVEVVVVLVAWALMTWPWVRTGAGSAAPAPPQSA